MQFIDLVAQQSRLRKGIDQAITQVLDHGRYIMGPEVAELETALAEFCGANHVVSCASGTDALVMALMVHGVGPGDAVFVPSFTFASTAEAVALLGATPVFVDVDAETFNIDANKLPQAIEALPSGLRPVGVIPVDLFGLPADYSAVHAAIAPFDMWVLADAAQSFGATRNGASVGSMASMTTTSFFPAKPLGCYGDGGAIIATDAGQVEVLRSIRVHGSGTEKYDNVRIGINGRLDTIQAAILLQKLSIFAEEIQARQVVANRYSAGLSAAGCDGLITVPSTPEGAGSTWAQYTIQVHDRAGVIASLQAEGVPTAVYYPRPLHQQTAYKEFPIGAGGLEVSERLATSVLSLPMHPYLQPNDQDQVIEAVRRAVSN
ncbi:MAG: DegT/DnrJ/EryC1/StrS family aminotransferase [Microthrixaceae bacterium]